MRASSAPASASDRSTRDGCVAQPGQQGRAASGRHGPRLPVEQGCNAATPKPWSSCRWLILARPRRRANLPQSESLSSGAVEPRLRELSELGVGGFLLTWLIGRARVAWWRAGSVSMAMAVLIAWVLPLVTTAPLPTGLIAHWLKL